MKTPLHVLHFADVHIGMENYGAVDSETGLNSRVVDFLRRMEEMTDYAKEHAVDLVIFAGDAFKTRTPNPTYQREFAWRIRDLAALAPVVMIVGNHDTPPQKIKANTLEIYETLDVPNVYVFADYEVQSIPTQRGMVVVGAAPYPIRSRVEEYWTDETRPATVKQADELVEATVSQRLRDMAAEADDLAGDEIPRVLIGHFTVRGAKLGSERGVMLGRDAQIALSVVADPRWDYVAMGHIHKHQNLTANRDDAPPVVYSGSLERIDFGEEEDVKGFCWVELVRGATRWQFVTVQTRPMVTVRADLRKDYQPTQTVIGLLEGYELKEAVVRIVLQLTPETNTLFNDNQIRDSLRRAGVFHVAAIRRDVERSERARLGENPEEQSHLELLSRYFDHHQVAAPRKAQLLEIAERLMEPTRDE